MKVKGFLKDVTGASRVVKARRNLIKESSPENQYKDHIRDVAVELHPAVTHVRVSKVEVVSPTAKKITFVPDQGDVLPPFQAGQYASLDFKIPNGDGTTTVTTRPYSICSAPYQARQGADSYFELTIRNGKPGVGYVSCWIYDNIKEGDTFTAHVPFGHFYYEPLRDASRVVALAGGSGITPFYSMAQEIAHGTLDMDLTILYGSVSTKDIILKEQLESIDSDRVRFVNVISGDEDLTGVESKEPIESGFVNRELIKKYTDGDPADGNTSYFVCGPLPMYNFVSGELKALGVPRRRIRMEVFGAPRDITQATGYRIRKAADQLPENSKVVGYPGRVADQVVTLTVDRGLEKTEIAASTAEPLAVAMERAGIPNNTRCRSGACGYCRSKLISGDVFVPDTGDGRRYADKKFGYVHACSTYPLGDTEIKIIID